MPIEIDRERSHGRDHGPPASDAPLAERYEAVRAASEELCRTLETEDFAGIRLARWTSG
jgi:hypothetical protein